MLRWLRGTRPRSFVSEISASLSLFFFFFGRGVVLQPARVCQIASANLRGV